MTDRERAFRAGAEAMREKIALWHKARLDELEHEDAEVKRLRARWEPDVAAERHNAAVFHRASTENIRALSLPEPEGRHD